MYVGNLKPHKNLEKLLEAYSILKNKENYELLLVGKAFEKYNVLEEKEEKLVKDKSDIERELFAEFNEKKSKNERS